MKTARKQYGLLTNLLKSDNIKYSPEMDFCTFKTQQNMEVKMVTYAGGKTHVLHELKRSFRAMGFVNVTGLPWVATMYDERGNVQASKKTLCRWNHKDNITIAVLENGEVWMRWGEFPDDLSNFPDDLRNFLRKICPKGTGAQTNLPENYVIDFRLILERAANAYSDHSYPAIPRPF